MDRFQKYNQSAKGKARLETWNDRRRNSFQIRCRICGKWTRCKSPSGISIAAGVHKSCAPAEYQRVWRYYNTPASKNKKSKIENDGAN